MFQENTFLMKTKQTRFWSKTKLYSMHIQFNEFDLPSKFNLTILKRVQCYSNWGTSKCELRTKKIDKDWVTRQKTMNDLITRQNCKSPTHIKQPFSVEYYQNDCCIFVKIKHVCIKDKPTSAGSSITSVTCVACTCESAISVITTGILITVISSFLTFISIWNNKVTLSLVQNI